MQKLTPLQSWRRAVIRVAVPLCLLPIALALIAPNWYTSLALVVLSIEIAIVAIVEWISCRSLVLK